MIYRLHTKPSLPAGTMAAVGKIDVNQWSQCQLVLSVSTLRIIMLKSSIDV